MAKAVNLSIEQDYVKQNYDLIKEGKIPSGELQNSVFDSLKAADRAKDQIGVNEENGEHLKYIPDGKDVHWGAYFINWLFDNPNTEKREKAPWGDQAGVTGIKNWGIENGKYISKNDIKSVKVGDILINKNNGASSVLIVTEVNKDSFNAVQGNSGNVYENEKKKGVVEEKRNLTLDNEDLTGIVRLNKSSSTQQPKEKEQEKEKVTPTNLGINISWENTTLKYVGANDYAEEKAQIEKLQKHDVRHIPEDLNKLEKQLNAVLKGGLKGKGAKFIEEGVKNGIDPTFLAAIAIHETGNGRVMRVNNAMGIDIPDQINQGKEFDKVDLSIEAGASLLKNKYISPPYNLVTIGDIRKKYCPVQGSDTDPNGLSKDWLFNANDDCGVLYFMEYIRQTEV